MKQKLFIVTIFSVAFFVRIFLSAYFLKPPFDINNDIKRYSEWAITARDFGANATYFPNNIKHNISVNNQPYGTVILYTSAFFLYQKAVPFVEIISKTAFTPKQFTNNFLYVVKFVPIVFDLLLGFVIFLFVKKYRNKKSAILSLLLYLFNPIVLYNSSVWGQSDTINNFFFVLSLFLLVEKKPTLSVISLISSFMIKLSLLPLLPLYVLFFFLIHKKHTFISLGVSLVIGSLYLFLFTFFAVSQKPIEWIYNFITLNKGGELSYITVYSFNFWWMVFRPKFLTDIPPSGQLLLGLPLDFWANSIFIILTIILLFFISLKDKKPKIQNFILYFIVGGFLMFLFLPRMHERYLFIIMPLIAIYLGFTRKHLLLFIGTVIINFINVYIVWHSLTLFPIVFEGLMSHWKVRFLMSTTLVLIGMFLYLNLFFNYRIDTFIKNTRRKLLKLVLSRS